MKKKIDKNKQEKTFASAGINWYPGHMLKTKREIIEDLKLIDIVVEILDARIPMASQNPDIANIIANKKHIVLLNKSDLADEIENKKWIEYFKTKDIIAIQTESNLGKGVNDVLKQIHLVGENIRANYNKGIINKKIRALIVGIPNVGKSSLINRICNRKTAQVGNKPGITRQKQWVRISNNIELLDTPGVLWPKFESEEIALNLAYTGSIKDDVIQKEEVVFSLLKYLYKNYKNNIINRYKLTEDEINNIIENDVYSLMKIIAKKRGAIRMRRRARRRKNL